MIGYESHRWSAYFWFVSWICISLGIHVCLSAPNIELHVPFGFIRLGRQANNKPWYDVDGWQFRRNVNMGAYH